MIIKKPFEQYTWLLLCTSWLVSSVITIVVLKRIFDNCNNFNSCENASLFTNYVDVSQQPVLLLIVLAITVVFIILRGVAVFKTYISSNEEDEEDYLDFLTADELSTKLAAIRRVNIGLLASWLIASTIFITHYLTGLFVANSKLLLAYICANWILVFFALIKIRSDYKLPSLSTYEYIKKSKLILIGLICLITLFYITSFLTISLFQVDSSKCIAVLSCSFDFIKSNPDINAWSEETLLSYELPIILSFTLLAVFNLWVLLILSRFRKGVFSLYKSLIFLSLFLLIILYISGLPAVPIYLQIGFKLNFFLLELYLILFFIKDMYKTLPRDSIIYRKEGLLDMLDEWNNGDSLD